MASVIKPPSTMASLVLPKLQSTNCKIWKPANCRFTFPHLITKYRTICCTNVTPWDQPPISYALQEDNQKGEFLTAPATLFETLDSDQSKTSPSVTTEAKGVTKVGYIRWPMWLLGPLVLLATGMVPTLWLPVSSIFLGPNIASLLSLTGLDCMFNLGASLFLLMADACSRPTALAQDPCRSKPPFSYRFWNMVAAVSGFIFPLTMWFGSQKGLFLFQPHLPPISFAILLGPYLLLLGVQMLTEMLTWHWESPVWLVTPVVYEVYRVLQLMRGLKLGAELGAPAWTVHMIRGLVCWWVLVLGVQVMRVAWYAGFTAHLRQNEPSTAS
ncbi:hypothetical protein SSX86_012363 [Deinandra increscens subsp. villosa]|uniref:Cytochrome P450 family protein n=1 Tax=Deinandra increscens subsp. villosa TaxID=3103831 RepID=A0AAP0D999_9ASTR